MTLSVKCPGCQQTLKVPDTAKGKKVKCPKCEKILAIAAPQTRVAAVHAGSSSNSGGEFKLTLPPAKTKTLVEDGCSDDTVIDNLAHSGLETLVLPPAKTLDATTTPKTRTPASTAAAPTSMCKCPSCQRGLKLASKLSGKKVKCPHCAAVFVVPPGFDFGEASFDTPAINGSDASDPFASNNFDEPFASNNFVSPSFTSSSFGAPATSPMPVQPSAVVQQKPAAMDEAPKARKPSKTDDLIAKGLIYRMPAMIGIGCAVLNLIIVLAATGLGCVSWFPRFKAIGLIIFIAASTIGAQVYAINGFIGILRMFDRNGGIQAAKGILACPFITAIVLGLGLGPFGIFLAAGVWVFMLLYNWPIGWWLWLMLEKKEAALDFDEVNDDDVDVSTLMSKKSKATAAQTTPAWSPVGIPVAATQEEQPTPQGMSPETKLKWILSGGAVAALLLVGGVVSIGVMAVSGSGEPAEAIDPPPDGWFAAKAAGVTMHFPSQPVEPQMGVGDMECWVAESEATESFFLFAAAPSGTTQTVEALGKNTARRLGGDVLGPRESTRGDMTGMTGRLSVSFKFPDMTVECYQHEGRTVILGYVSGSSLRSRGGDSMSRAASPAEEKAEQETFFESIHFAPPSFFGY